MMKSLFAAASALVFSAAAASAQTGGPAETYVYDFPNFQGSGVTARESIADLTRWNFDDKATSIRVLSGQWEVCTGVDFTGRCETIVQDNWDLTGLDLNNQISSMRPARPGGYPDDPGYPGDDYDDYDEDEFGDEGGYDDGYGDETDGNYGYEGAPSLTLYQYEYFDGTEVEIERGVRDLQDRRFDDFARSLRVGEGVWRVCEDPYFGGDCKIVEDDVPDLDALGLSGRISSAGPAGGSDYDDGPDYDDDYGPRPGESIEGYRAGFFPSPRSDGFAARECVRGEREACRDFADAFCRAQGYREGAHYSIDRTRGAVRDILCVRG